jgi:NADH-ubiquinone oxidoreductase chain 3
MSAMTILILLVCIIALLFIFINLIFAPHNPYQEKSSAFECGFHNFLQTRFPFNISFYIYGLLFLLFDLEIFLVFPYAVSSYNNEFYGLLVLLIFLILVTLGFVFELGKDALNIPTRQQNPSKEKKNFITSFSLIKNKVNK